MLEQRGVLRARPVEPMLDGLLRCVFIYCLLPADQSRGATLSGTTSFSRFPRRPRSFRPVPAGLLQYLQDVLSLEFHQAIRRRGYPRCILFTLRISLRFCLHV